MLVLTRKLQEQISIGQDITITILRVKGNTVRIGIDAPASVRVLRGELPRHETEPRRNAPLPETPRRETVRTNPGDLRGSSANEPAGTPERQHPSPHVGTRTTGLKPIVQRLGQRTARLAPLLGVAAPVLVD